MTEFRSLQQVAQSYLGELWLALDVRGGEPGQPVLLRRMGLPADTPAEALQRIACAGRDAMALSHENIAPVLAVLQQEGTLTIAYAYAEAEPLRSLQSWAAQRGVLFPVEVSLRIIIDLLRGVKALHGSLLGWPSAPPFGGLSPDSILVSRDGRTRLCDPLISSCATLLEGFGTHPTKLAYTAPEQVHATSPLGATSDVFSCAAMLWELLSGTPLLSGSKSEIERKLLEHDLPRLSDHPFGQRNVSAELVEIVERSLSSDGAKRPQTPAALATELEQCGHEIGSVAQVAQFVGELAGAHFAERAAALRTPTRVAAPAPAGTAALPAATTPMAKDPAPRGFAGRRIVPLPERPGASASTARMSARGAAPQPPVNAPRAPLASISDLEAWPEPEPIAKTSPKIEPKAAAPALGQPKPAVAAPAAPVPAAAAALAPKPETVGTPLAKPEVEFAARPLAKPRVEANAPVFAPRPKSSSKLGGHTLLGLGAREMAALAAQRTTKSPADANVQPPTGPTPEPARAAPARPISSPPAAAAAALPPDSLPVELIEDNEPTAIDSQADIAALRPEPAPARPVSSLPPPARLISSLPAPPISSVPPAPARPISSLPPPPARLISSLPAAPLSSSPPQGTKPDFLSRDALRALPLEDEETTDIDRQHELAPMRLDLAPRTSGWSHAPPAISRTQGRALYAAAAITVLLSAVLAIVFLLRSPSTDTAVAPAPAAASVTSAELPPPREPATAPPPASSAAEPGPNAEPTADTPPAEPAADAAAQTNPSSVLLAGEFANVALKDDQLLQLFAFEPRAELPSCAKRLGANARRYKKDAGKSKVQLQAARRELVRGDLDKAMHALCAAITHSAANAEAWQAMAELALQLGDAEQAKRAIEQALKRKPNDPVRIGIKGDVLAMLRDLPRSRALWARSASVKGTGAARQRRLAALFSATGERRLKERNHGSALAYYRRAAVLSAGSHGASAGMAKALSSLDHANAARAWSERIEQAFPTSRAAPR